MAAKFQSAPPRGGDKYAPGPMLHRVVSIRAPARGRRRFMSEIQRRCAVSIRAPARGRPPDQSGLGVSCFVSIRAPARGRLLMSPRTSALRLFQSAPPRGGDIRWRLRDDRGHVSIRAPARGRRAPLPPPNRRPRFQSAPPRGGDVLRLGVGRREHAFQSAPPRGGDEVYPGEAVEVVVSIRAPARGRQPFRDGAPFHLEFQSAPPRGGDIAIIGGLSAFLRFNPRPREGATTRDPAPPGRRRCFNPRPREGATISGSGVRSNIAGVSIRAPARGRLGTSTCPRSPFVRFNPRPREGATGTRSRSPGRKSFNPRPREGATLETCRNVWPSRKSFNPRPREGATRVRQALPLLVDVSIRAPARGRRFGVHSLPLPEQFQSAPPRGGDDARIQSNCT